MIVATKLRIDIRPYFPRIANHYWDNLSAANGSIWDWLKRDYGIIKIGSVGSKPELWVTFPDERSKTMFYLRWA